MSLRHCPECGHEISTFAEKCPECGFPYKKYKKIASLHGFNITSDKFVEMYWISKPNKNVPYIQDDPEKKCAECGTKLLGNTICPSCGFCYRTYKEEKRLQQEAYRKRKIEETRETEGNVDQPLMVHCPGCKKTVSYYADTCPDCGFPIQKFISEHNIQDIKKVHICPKCAELYAGINYEKQPLYMTCEFCNTPMLETDADSAEVYFEKHLNWQNPDVDGLAIKILSKYDIKPDQSAVQHRYDVLKRRKQDEERQERIQEQANIPAPNIPKCPVCGSTNIEQIGAFNRAASTVAFGIASSKIGKQWHCKNCGYNF